jgi:hypothetical protein
MFDCAWCLANIPEDTEIFSLGTKAFPGIDLSNHEGKFLSMRLLLAKRTVKGLVVPKDSPAKKDGNDIVFALCSAECSRILKTALQNEKDVGGLMSMN